MDKCEMDATLQTMWSVNLIRSAMQDAGSHWWDADTMRFFGTRVLGDVIQGPGGVYFVTSEKPPDGPRRCSVRRYLPHTNDIETVGAFCTMALRQARALARRRAEGRDHVQS